VLDDLVGMLSPRLFEQYARPMMSRIFQAFDGLIKVYHNDTPCPHLLTPMASLGFDVFNFSHTTDIAEVQARMPGIALMGNVPPLDSLGLPPVLKEVVLEQLFKVRIGSADLAPAPAAAPAVALQPGWREIHGTNGGATPSEPRMLAGAKVGRNNPCPCGSGKKYKKCCLLKGV